MNDPTIRVFAMLSGGIDSTTTLAMARQDFPYAQFEAVTFDYGQRHKNEIAYAAQQAHNYGAEHHVIDMAGLVSGMLVDKGIDNESIPDKSYAELPTGISPTYVSFRNGLMLSLLAARAQGWVMAMEKNFQKAVANLKSNQAIATESYEAVIYCGVHADDGARDAYPDCTLEFVGAMANAIYVGTYFKVRLRTPLVHMDKPDVVARGLELEVDYAHTWSCYKGGDHHCGVCPTCRARKEAFELNGVVDPTVYMA